MPVVAARIAVPSNKPALDAALAGLVRLNMVIIEQRAASGRPLAPPSKTSAVRWRPDKGETWDTWDVVTARGYGDCEDLAAATAAYLRLQGVQANAVVQHSNSPGVAWHAVVQMPDGRIVDPSAQMGMYEYHAAARRNARRKAKISGDLAKLGAMAERLGYPEAAAVAHTIRRRLGG